MKKHLKIFNAVCVLRKNGSMNRKNLINIHFETCLENLLYLYAFRSSKSRENEKAGKVSQRWILV